MISNKTCPCCGSKISFWNYFYEDNFKDSKNKDKHIRCKKCKNVILPSWRPRTITNVAVLVIFMVSMYLFIKNLLNWLWFIIFLIFIFVMSYISYRKEKFICYDEKELRYEKESNFGGIIFAMIVLGGALITFWSIFSFALDMKAKNHQKHKSEYIKKDKQ